MKTCMKLLGTLAVVASIANADQISMPSLLVFRVDGNGAALGSDAAIVYVDEYTTNGTLIQSIQLPYINTGTCLTASGTASSEGKLHLSPNNQWLALVGYNQPENTANVKGSTTRTIARISIADGSVDVSTTGNLGGNDNARAAVPNNDGTKFWYATTNGIYYVPHGTSASVILYGVNARGCNIFGGQLYAWGDAVNIYGVYAVGNGLPETTGQTLTGLPGVSGNSTLDTYGFFLADLDTSVPGYDTLWMARDATGVSKYSLVNGTWTLNNTIGGISNVIHIAGCVNTDNSVSLYVVANGGSTIRTLRDTSGYNANMPGSFETIISAGQYQAFRGVAATMIPEPGAFVLGGLMLLAALRRR